MLEDCRPADPRLLVRFPAAGQRFRVHPGSLLNPVLTLRSVAATAEAIDDFVLGCHGFRLTDLLEVALRYSDHRMGVLTDTWPDSGLALDRPDPPGEDLRARVRRIARTPVTVTGAEVSAAAAADAEPGDCTAACEYPDRAAAAWRWATRPAAEMNVDLFPGAERLGAVLAAGAPGRAWPVPAALAVSAVAVAAAVLAREAAGDEQSARRMQEVTQRRALAAFGHRVAPAPAPDAQVPECAGKPEPPASRNGWPSRLPLTASAAAASLPAPQAYSPLGLCHGHESAYRFQGRPGGPGRQRRGSAGSSKQARLSRSAMTTRPGSAAGARRRCRCRAPGPSTYAAWRPWSGPRDPVGPARPRTDRRACRMVLGWVQAIANACRGLNCLADLDTSRFDHTVRNAVTEMLAALRLIYLAPAETREAGYLEFGHFGADSTIRRSRFDLTEVSQRWLRDLLWDYTAAQLRSPQAPRSRGSYHNIRRASPSAGSWRHTRPAAVTSPACWETSTPTRSPPTCATAPATACPPWPVSRRRQALGRY